MCSGGSSPAFPSLRRLRVTGAHLLVTPPGELSQKAVKLLHKKKKAMEVSSRGLSWHAQRFPKPHDVAARAYTMSTAERSYAIDTFR